MFVSIGRSETAVGSVVGYGKVQGVVTDSKTGETLIGVTVVVDGTRLGAATDLDGKFVIRNVPYGTYLLSISSIGYAKIQVSDVVVGDAPAVDLQIQLSPQVYEQKAVTVTAKRLMNNESSLLKHRQAAIAVSDAISSEAIARAGGGNAAQAMTKVVGASLVGGKYVYVRGLGDRYGNTQLNGSQLPSPDAEKQAAPLDIIPSGLLDNIIVTKSFTPEMAGNFTGGSVNLTTKDFPESRTLSVTIGSSYNSLTTFSHVLSYSGGSRDWLGYDDGTRDLPTVLQDPANVQKMPNGRVIFKNSEQAHLVDNASRSFSNQLSPERSVRPLNQNYNASFGNTYQLFGRALGLTSSLSYTRNYSNYESGRRDSYAAAEIKPGQAILEPQDLFSDSRSMDEVLWGTLTSITYGLAQHHKIGMNLVYDRSGTSEARYIQGYSLERADSNTVYRSRVLGYIQRTLSSVQLHGEHVFAKIRPSWQISRSLIREEQPDLRQSSDEYYIDRESDPIDTFYQFGSNYAPPARFWRDTRETNNEYKLDVGVPVSHSINFKFGTNYLEKTRTNRQTQFNLIEGSLRYNDYGNFDDYLSHTGIIDSVSLDNPRTPEVEPGYRYDFASYWTNSTFARDQYDAFQKISANYGMTQIEVLRSFTLTGGVRAEHTQMRSRNQDPASKTGNLQQTDWLPALGVTYHVNNVMNIRLAYGRTLARPSLREMSAFSSEEFAGARFFSGNPELKMTKVKNYDLRWEWFRRPGEILAISGFYKSFTDPIEIRYYGTNGERQPANVDAAKCLGIELEIRKRLDEMWAPLRNFDIGGNLTLVHSEVTIPDGELALMRMLDPSAKSTRPMAYQSPYVVNVNVGYNQERTGFNATVYFNVVGRRFYYNSLNQTPDVYELAHHFLDITASKRLFAGVQLKLAAKNLLDDDFHAVYLQTGTDKQTTFEQRNIGRSYSLGFVYQIF
jgi:TonB-dependent receptor